MKRTWWIGLLTGGAVSAVVFTTASGLQASSRGGGGADKVVCLDIVQIFNEYERQKDLAEEMRSEQEKMQAESEERRGHIDSLQATLDAMSTNDPLYSKKMREMLRLQLDYKNWADLMQADMAREVGIWTQRVYGELLGVAEELAQLEGYDIVLYKSPPNLIGFDPEAVKEQIRLRQVIYASRTVDITQVVLDKLNADYRALPKAKMLQIGLGQ